MTAFDFTSLKIRKKNRGILVIIILAMLQSLFKSPLMATGSALAFANLMVGGAIIGAFWLGGVGK